LNPVSRSLQLCSVNFVLLIAVELKYTNYQ